MNRAIAFTFTAIVCSLLIANSAWAQEQKVELKQSTPEEAAATYCQSIAQSDWETFCKVADADHQRIYVQSLIVAMAELDLISKKDPNFQSYLENRKEVFKSIGVRDLTVYAGKQYNPTTDDLKAINAITDKLTALQKLHGVLKTKKVYKDWTEKFGTFKFVNKQTVGPYEVILLVGKNQGRPTSMSMAFEKTAAGWIASIKGDDENRKQKASQRNERAAAKPPREVKTVELKLGTPEEAFETLRSALIYSDWATAFSAATKDSQLGMVRAAFFEVESANFSGSEEEFKAKRKTQGELFKKYGVKQGSVGLPEALNKPAIMSDLKACYLEVMTWSAANNTTSNDFQDLLKHEIESKEIQATTAKILCKPITHERNEEEYPVYILVKSDQGWQVDLETSRTAGLDRQRGMKNQAAKSSTSGIRLKHVFSAIEKQPKEKHGIEITALSFSPDSRRVAVSAVGQPIQVWDLEKPERILSIPLPKSDFPLHSEVAWSPDGKLLAIAINSGDSSESLGLYSIQDKRFVNPLPKQKSKVCDIQWVGADRLFFGVSDWTDSHVQFGKAPPWKPQYNTVLKGHGISSAAISPDGTLAAASTGESAVLLGADGKETAKLPAGEGNEIIQFAFSPTGKQLAIGRRDKLELYDTTEKTSKVLLPKTEGWVKSLAFTPDGAKLIVLTRKISILDPQTAKVLAEQKASGSIAALSPSGKVLITGADELNGEVSIWDLDIEVGPSLLPAVEIAQVKEATKPEVKAPAPTLSRMWTSADGMFKIEAEFVQQKQGFVQLKRKDNGALVSIPIAKLSEADQELLKTLP